MLKKDSKILIVGHNDIIEKSLYRHFVDNGYKAVISSSEVVLNTTIQSSVYHFFAQERPEFIFLGSVRSGGIEANQKFAADFIYENLESQNNVLYCAYKFGIKKLLYFAASCVYPKECKQPIREEYLLTGPLEATSQPYSLAKIAGTELCKSYRKQYGLNAIVAVPPTVFGPESETDALTSHVIGALIGKFVDAGKNNLSEVTVWGSGNPKREFLYADDFTDAALFLMEKYNNEEIINIGTGADIAIKDLAQVIAKIAGFKGKIVFDASRPDGAPQKLLDNSKIKRLGWRPRVSLEEGLAKTIEWYKNNIKETE